jgi:hypothetical protein
MIKFNPRTQLWLTNRYLFTLRLRDALTAGATHGRLVLAEILAALAGVLNPELLSPPATITMYASPRSELSPGGDDVVYRYTYHANTPGQVIDFICDATPGWLLDGFYVGDTNMFMGGGPVPAVCFDARVVNRGIRFSEYPAGIDIVIYARCKAGTPMTAPPHITLKLEVKLKDLTPGSL